MNTNCTVDTLHVVSNQAWPPNVVQLLERTSITENHTTGAIKAQGWIGGVKAIIHPDYNLLRGSVANLARKIGVKVGDIAHVRQFLEDSPGVDLGDAKVTLLDVAADSLSGANPISRLSH